VAELDYESLYPNIITRGDVSYETVEDGRRDGLLKAVALEALKRRLHFKHLKRRLPKEDREWLWCHQRSKALKGILVCIYGYSGCFANRFGNIATFEEINRIAREKLVETMNIAMERGFRVIYADTDSIFVKKEDASREDYEQLAYEISREVGFPLALDHHYKFLVFLHRRTDPRIEVAKRYFGALYDGSLHYRGIELRRRDTPPFIKEFQETLMKILFDADSPEEVRGRQVSRVLEYVEEAYRKLKGGQVDWGRLVISKRLSKDVGEYRCNLPHVTAAKQLSLSGLKLRAGALVEYILLNEGDTNPYRRVASAALLTGQGARYDAEKYADLLLEAAETVLSVFGFQRERFKASRKPRPVELVEVM
jgi:DNA polymerase elongation subunit (family B)